MQFTPQWVKIQRNSTLRWLDVHLGMLSLNEITLDVIDRVKSARIQVASKSTANRYLSLLRAILRKARDEWEWVEKVPKIRQYREAAGRERSITMQQAETLLRELPRHHRALVLFSLSTGLRQKNVLRLKWANVDLQRQHAWVAASHSKNGKPIAVPLNSTAMKVLEEQRGKHPEFVFTYFGKPLNSANTKAWKAALARAEINDFRWHDLRHTWATWHRQSGTPTHELQRLGGWKTASMVERYAHLAPDHLASAASRIDSSFGTVAKF
jgi:integrase